MFFTKAKNSMPWLFEDKIPVWLSLLIIISGAVGTCFVVPYFNMKFEQEKIRSSYIASNLTSTNENTSLLLNQLREIKVALEKGEENGLDKEIYSFQNLITTLQWKAVEYDVIFGDGEINKLVYDYKYQLSLLGDEVNKGRDINISVMYCRARNFIYSSHKILRKISSIAELSLSKEPAFAIPSSIDCEKEVESSGRKMQGEDNFSSILNESGK
jgi:hypothetical protein